MKRHRQLFRDLHSFVNTTCCLLCNCPSGNCDVMNSEQAHHLVKKQTHLIRQWVCDHCGDNKRLIPLALIYVHQRLSEQDWQLIRQYDDRQPFEEFIREHTEDALEVFSYGIWFGKCSKTINYWIKRYGIKGEIRKQDAADYVKNKLTKDNFARFRAHKQKGAAFSTYLSRIIRNLLIDYLRKKTPETETLENVERNNDYILETLTGNSVEFYEQQHLEEMSQWFFEDMESKESNKAMTPSADIPDAIKLSPKERLFLRAIYKDGMSITEAGRLPGIHMGRWQAYEHHRNLKKRIKKMLNAMGYKNLKSLLNPN